MNYLIAGLTALVGSAHKLGPAFLESHTDSALAPAVRWTISSIWFLVPVLALLALLVSQAEKTIAPPERWKAVEKEINDLREEIFDFNSVDPVHFHRATLFKYFQYDLISIEWILRRRLPWSGWLVSVCRSGHTTLNHTITFDAPDDADQSEGIAGACWKCKEIVQALDLPDLHSKKPKAADKNEYAEKSYTPQRMMNKKLLPHARSLVGLPVEVGGKIWGVVVIDSRNPNLDVPKITEIYKKHADTLSKLVECV